MQKSSGDMPHTMPEAKKWRENFRRLKSTTSGDGREVLGLEC
jgi:hypothetical protein